MILKVRVHTPGTPAERDQWDYLDAISKVRAFPVAEEGEGWRLFGSVRDLREWVDYHWGPAEARVFAEELWPEFHTDETEAVTVKPVVAWRTDHSMVFVLAASECYLLSDDGKTVDRLR